MQFKHKLIYFSLGCAFVVIGQVLLSVVVPRVTAQGKKESVEFDTVKVRSLQVVDDAGKVRAKLEVTKRSSVAGLDDVIQVFNGDGVPVYGVGVSADGASVLVTDNENRKSCLLGKESVLFFGNNGKPCAMMTNDEAGGVIAVRGGVIAVFGDKKEKEAVSISANAYGGRAHFYGNDGKSRAAIGVTEYGDGAVSTWDKNGYRLR